MINTSINFKAQVLKGIPDELPAQKPYPSGSNRAPKRKDILSKEEKRLAIKNALRYFPNEWHAELAPELPLNDTSMKS